MATLEAESRLNVLADEALAEETTLTPEQVQSRLQQLGQLGSEALAEGGSPQQLRLAPGSTVTIDDQPTFSSVLGAVGTQALVVKPNQTTRIIGTPNDDILEGTGGRDNIYGLEGDDRIFGFLSADYIDAGPGNDIVVGGGGNDTVDGGSGSDLILGDFNPNADPNSSALGDDLLNGGLGNDILFGQNGKDTLNGEAGADSLYGGNGDDTLNGGSGNDIAEGGEGNDIINGDIGNDRLYGDDGNDTIDSGSGKDKIFGGRGNDLLRGGSEDDELTGGLGNDQLEGGTGNDRLIGVDTTVLSVPELGFGRGEKDTLTGGANNDIFFLGTQIPDGRDFVFYNDGNRGNAGLVDYALITDFGLFNNTQNRGWDQIQLAGLRSSYSLGASPSTLESGTGIFFLEGTTGSVPELIGIVQNISVSQLNLNDSSQFIFV